MLEFVAVGAGGFIGCCLRFLITRTLVPLDIPFPLATLISNVLAGFFTGFIITMERNTSCFSPKAKLFLTTGLMGGLSTFSAFSLETVDLFSKGSYLYAAGNVFLNLSFGILGVVFGIVSANLILKNIY